ncbi:MAG: hypothetical protein EBR82_38570 [Caulobacteraceae bacterium]|nr:hypothetical protein [Caulobacteraceae bacterium]
MMCPDLVVGEVGFGPNFGAMAESNWHLAEKLRIEEENRELIKEINRLKWVLERCTPADNNVANERLRALGRGNEP